MDTSKEYTEMCQKATAIQAQRVPLWGFCSFESGDMFYKGEKYNRVSMFIELGETRQPTTTESVVKQICAQFNITESMLLGEQCYNPPTDDRYSLSSMWWYSMIVNIVVFMLFDLRTAVDAYVIGTVIFVIIVIHHTVRSLINQVKELKEQLRKIKTNG